MSVHVLSSLSASDVDDVSNLLLFGDEARMAEDENGVATMAREARVEEDRRRLRRVEAVAVALRPMIEQIETRSIMVMVL